MAKRVRKREYKRYQAAGETVRTVPDLNIYASGAGMPAILVARGFRIETHGGRCVMVTEQRYMLR